MAKLKKYLNGGGLNPLWVKKQMIDNGTYQYSSCNKGGGTTYHNSTTNNSYNYSKREDDNCGINLNSIKAAKIKLDFIRENYPELMKNITINININL